LTVRFRRLDRTATLGHKETIERGRETSGKRTLRFPRASWGVLASATISVI
jgi:hypothetical protein